MIYLQLPSAPRFDDRAALRLLDRAKISLFLASLLSGAIVLCCVSGFIWEWWISSTSSVYIKFFINERIDLCDASGSNCVSATPPDISAGSAGFVASRDTSLFAASVNLFCSLVSTVGAARSTSLLFQLTKILGGGLPGGGSVASPQSIHVALNGALQDRWRGCVRGGGGVQTHPATSIARLGRDVMLLSCIVGIVSGLVSLIPFGVCTNLWLGTSYLVNDATFSQGPGSAFFSSSVTIAVWMIVFFNIRRGRSYITSAAQLFQHVAAAPLIADVTPIGGGGGNGGHFPGNAVPPSVYTQVSVAGSYTPSSFASPPSSYVPPADLDFHSNADYPNHASY